MPGEGFVTHNYDYSNTFLAWNNLMDNITNLSRHLMPLFMAGTGLAISAARCKISQ